MKKIIIAVLLSIIAGPGFGQLYNKEIKKGLLLIGVSFAVVLLFFSALVSASVDLLPKDPNQITVELVSNIQRQLYQKHPKPFNMFNITILFFWVYGIIDAYIVAQKRRTNAVSHVGTDASN